MSDKSHCLDYMMESLMGCMKSQFENGIENIDAEEAGEVADIIKDLAEAKYYCTVVKSMEEGGRRPEYTVGMIPGEMYGYRPYMDNRIPNDFIPYDYTPGMYERMGYHDGMEDYDYSHRFGKAYNEYKNAKRHYTQTNSSIDKDKMDMSTSQHLNDMVMSMREMWKDADPTLREHMRKSIQMLLEDMKS